jgi:hypothetical protein
MDNTATRVGCPLASKTGEADRRPVRRKASTEAR